MRHWGHTMVMVTCQIFFSTEEVRYFGIKTSLTQRVPEEKGSGSHSTPIYDVFLEQGPDHDKIFHVAVSGKETSWERQRQK